MTTLLQEFKQPWAMERGRFVHLHDTVAAYLRRENKIVDANQGGYGESGRQYEVRGGVAIIPVVGILAKRPSLLLDIFGGTATSEVAEQFRMAMADPNVHTSLLYIDSPGGTVDGTQALAREIFNARGQGKNIVAFSNGLMASAAYWIGAQAHRAYISGDTDTVGSIGVVARHIDVSRAYDAAGVKVTEITAGRYKRAASEYEPLSETGRRTIQEMLDHVYTVFLSDVAKARTKLSLDPVKTAAQEGFETIPWADGRLFLGQQAIDRGLVDGFATLEQLIKSKGSLPGATSRRATVASSVDIDRLPIEQRAKVLWNRDPQLREEFKMGGFNSYLGWMRSEERKRS